MRNQELAVRALESGMRLGCLSACDTHGIWTPPHTSPHFLYHRKRAKPQAGKLQFGAHIHPVSVFPNGAVAGLTDALKQVVRFHDAMTSIVVLESALNQRKVDYFDVVNILNSVPERKSRLLRKLNSSSQSGSESRVRHFLQSKRVRLQTQVVIEGVGRVDILVGNSLIIECDSWAHHSQGEGYAKDRQRDAQAVLRGYTVLRLTYWQVWNDWETTKGLLLDVIRKRVHERFPK